MVLTFFMNEDSKVGLTIQERSLQEFRLLEVSKNILFNPLASLFPMSMLLDKMFLVANDREPTQDSISKKGFLGSHPESGLALDVAGCRGSRVSPRPALPSLSLSSTFLSTGSGSGQGLPSWWQTDKMVASSSRCTTCILNKCCGKTTSLFQLWKLEYWIHYDWLGLANISVSEPITINKKTRYFD